MRLLPEIHPGTAPFPRRHSPRPATDVPGAHTVYRRCLRWEFGFTCVYCLVHETDLARGLPVEGEGSMTIDHFIPVSTKAPEPNAYENCYLACRQCNRAKDAFCPPDDGELLDPCHHAWAEHFELVEGNLEPAGNDPRAKITLRVCQLNSERKIEIRQFRKQAHEEHRATLRATPSRIASLLALAEELRPRQPETSDQLLACARQLDEAQRKAWRDLARWRPEPRDRPRSCRCEKPPALELPPPIEAQVVTVTENG